MSTNRRRIRRLPRHDQQPEQLLSRFRSPISLLPEFALSDQERTRVRRFLEGQAAWRPPHALHCLWWSSDPSCELCRPFSWTAYRAACQRDRQLVDRVVPVGDEQRRLALADWSARLEQVARALSRGVPRARLEENIYSVLEHLGYDGRLGSLWG